MTRPSALLPAEARLVLSADAPEASSSGAERARHLTASELEWPRLLDMAHRERAALPLWRMIREADWVREVPEAQVLRKMAQLWEFKLLHLERLLLQSLAQFAEEGIDVVLLKGAAVTLSIYGEFGRRPMFDVDLLVRPEQARAAWDLARESEWTWDADRFPLSAFENAHHLPPLLDEFGSGSGMEIHTELWLTGHPFRFSAVDVWRDAWDLEVKGARFRVPSVTHQLVHCCIHFAWSHRMQTHAWRAFRDVAAFTSVDGLDWDELVSLAKETRADTSCYWTLRLAKTINGVPVPDEVIDALAPALPGFLLRRLERNYIMNLLTTGDDGCPSITLQNRLWRWGVQRKEPDSGIDLPEDPVPMGLAGRMSHHARSVVDWARYVRQLV